MPRTTNHGVQPHRHILPDVPSASQYLVYPGGHEDGAYSSIQAAINQAVLDGHEDADNPAVVLVRAGRYVENLFLYRGVWVQGLPDLLFGVMVVGTVVATLSDSGDVFKNVTGMTGISIETPPGGVGLFVTGSVAQQIYISSIAILAKAGGGKAVVIDNTGSMGMSPSALIIGEMRLIAELGAASPAIEISAGQFVADDFVSQFFDQTMVALQTLANGSVVVSTGLFGGGVRLEGVSGIPDILGNILVTSNGPREALFVGAGGLRLITGSFCTLGGTTPNVTGTGSLAVGSPLTFLAGGSGISPTVTIVPGIASMPQTYYVPGSPAAVAAWVLPVPPTQEEALDRMAIQLAALGGPIP